MAIKMYALYVTTSDGFDGMFVDKLAYFMIPIIFGMVDLASSAGDLKNRYVQVR